MADLRTQLALVLGVALGLVLIVFPDGIRRMYTLGRMPHERSGEYGADTELSTRWRRGIQALGVVVIVIAVAVWL